MTKLPAYSSAQDLLNRFATFFKEKIYKIRDELPDCSDIDLNIPQDKPPSFLSFFFKPQHRRRYGISDVSLTFHSIVKG